MILCEDLLIKLEYISWDFVDDVNEFLPYILLAVQDILGDGEGFSWNNKK